LAKSRALFPHNKHGPITYLQNQSKMNFKKTIVFLLKVVAVKNYE